MEETEKRKNTALFREESKPEKDDIDKEDKDEDKAKNDSNKGDEKEAAVEAQKADKEEAEATKDAEEKSIKFSKVEKGAKVEIEYEGFTDEEIEATVMSLMDAKKTEKDNDELDDTAKAETPEADKSMDGEEINSETESKRFKQIIKNNEVITKMNDILNSKKPTEITNLQIRAKALKKNKSNWAQTLDDEYAERFIQNIKDVSYSGDNAIDEYELCKSITLCSSALEVRNFAELKNALTTRAIDGSSYATGLAYISIINDPEVKTELERTLPEIKGADFIQLDTLDIVQKDLQIPASGNVTSIPEGQASSTFNGSTVSIKFDPLRYALEHQVNIKLPNFSQVMEKETLNGKNGIVTALRKQFYTNLVAHKAQTFASLAPTGLYLGGITKDALLGSVLSTGLSIPDLDNIINTLESTYGNETIKEKFVFLMHPNTRSFIFTTLRKEFNAVWVADDTMSTFRGIDIVTAPMFPGSVNPLTGEASAGTLAFILCRKDTIAVRGFNFVIEDNPFIDMSKGLATRYQNTRGEMKLYDPYLNTYAIQVGVVTTFTVEKVESMSDEEINNLIENKELLNSQAKDVRKAAYLKQDEINKQAKQDKKR